MVDFLTTNNPQPTVTGTASLVFGDLLSVVVNGVNYTDGDGNLVSNADGTWALIIPVSDALPDAIYDVKATVSDGAGNGMNDSTTDELVVDLTPPPTPTVTNLLTSNPSPVVSGTAVVVAGDTLEVVVNGVSYVAGDGNLVDNGNGTWDLTIPVADALPDAAYDVLVTVTDAVGNASIDASVNELVVDLVPPIAPGVTSQTTQDSTPVINGTLPNSTGNTLIVTVNGVTYTLGDGNLVDNADGTWSLTIPPRGGCLSYRRSREYLCRSWR